jgi:hypothetical protein
MHEFAQGEIHDAGTRERHAEEYRCVNAEDYMGEADGGCTAADPGSGHDCLGSVVGNLAALIGFVLHAPLTDLLAEGKAGKLTATSNAVCHEY